MPPTIPPVPPPHDHSSPRGSRRGGVHGAHGCSGGGEADLCQAGRVVVAAASPATVAAGSAVRVGRRGWLESGARPAPPTAAVTKADPLPPHGLAQAPPARAWVGVPAALWAFPHVPIQGLWVMWVRVAEKTAGGCSGEEGRPGRECRPPCEQRGQTRRCCPVRRPLRRVSAAPPPPPSRCDSVRRPRRRPLARAACAACQRSSPTAASSAATAAGSESRAGDAAAARGAPGAPRGRRRPVLGAAHHRHDCHGHERPHG